jgi:hypothetical protein
VPKFKRLLKNQNKHNGDYVEIKNIDLPEKE